MRGKCYTHRAGLQLECLVVSIIQNACTRAGGEAAFAQHCAAVMQQAGCFPAVIATLERLRLQLDTDAKRLLVEQDAREQAGRPRSVTVAVDVPSAPVPAHCCCAARGKTRPQTPQQRVLGSLQQLFGLPLLVSPVSVRLDKV